MSVRDFADKRKERKGRLIDLPSVGGVRLAEQCLKVSTMVSVFLVNGPFFLALRGRIAVKGTDRRGMVYRKIEVRGRKKKAWVPAPGDDSGSSG